VVYSVTPRMPMAIVVHLVELAPRLEPSSFRTSLSSAFCPSCTERGQ